MSEADPRALAQAPEAYDAGVDRAPLGARGADRGAFLVGLHMADLPFSPLRFRLFNWHKWAGMLVLVLSALRMLWRLGRASAPPRRRPCRPGRRRPIARPISRFYVLFFAVPLLGWAYTSAVGVPVVWFGVLPLPDLVPLDKAFGDEVWKPLHAGLVSSAGLVVLHVVAALKHQFIDRDGCWRACGRGAPKERT